MTYSWVSSSDPALSLLCFALLFCSASIRWSVSERFFSFIPPLYQYPTCMVVHVYTRPFCFGPDTAGFRLLQSRLDTSIISPSSTIPLRHVE